MAEKLKIPNEVWDANWTDDIDDDISDIGYATYKNEREYVSKDDVDSEDIKKIKAKILTEKRIRKFLDSKVKNIAQLSNAKAA